MLKAGAAPVSPPTFCPGFCFSASFFLVIFGGRESRARLCSYILLILYQLLLSYWLRVGVKIHCDQSHEAKLSHLTLTENMFCVDSQKQCKSVCVFVCMYVFVYVVVVLRKGIQDLYFLMLWKHPT